ncbi:MAG: Signal peptidase I [Oscillospiraceae bacterium]|jgi:multisubunit Na+/H+ antiporter MnhB subunit
MDENGKTPQKDYSVEEILAEARIIKNREPPPAHDTARDEPSNREEILLKARRALNMEAGSEGPPSDGGKSEPEPEKKKKKKHRFSLFGRRKKREEWREEDDIYYGLQLRPLEEYRKEYEKTILAEGKTPSTDHTGSSFPYLFDGSGQDDGPGMAETFERIHRERHERLEKIMRQAGLDPEEILPQEAPVQQPEVPAPGPSEPEIPQPEPPHGPAVTPGPQREPEPHHPATQPVPEPPAKPEITADAGKNDTQKGESPSESEKNEPSKAEKTPPPVKEPAKVPPKAKEERRIPPPRTEPTDHTKPSYRCISAPVHTIEPKSLQEILEAEAAAYPMPEPPEPIPFPQKGPVKPEEPDNAPSDGQEQNPQPDALPESPDILVNTSSAGEQMSIPAAESAKEVPDHSSSRKFRLFGSDEPVDPYDEPPPEPEELDDYTSPSDAPSIRHDLLKNLTRLSLRLAVTGIATLILLAVGILAEYPAILPPDLHTMLSSPSYPVIQLVFLLIAVGFNFSTVWNGIKGMTSFQANSDSAVSIAVLTALIQNVVLLILGIPQGIYLYAPLAAAAIFLNTVGKFSMMRRIYLNFRVLCSKDRKYAVHLYNDYNTALRLAQDCVLGEPRIAYQSEAKFLRNFLKISYAPDPSDHLSHILAPAGLLLSLALCAASAFLAPGGGFTAAVTILAVSCCICVPFTNMLCVNLPVSRLCSIARRSGSLLSGWKAIDRFSETNAVMLDAQDLFPRGTVILNGIRTFAGQRIDEAILDAAALMCTIGGPLADVFDQIIKSRREILPKISKPVYEDGKGVTGTVSGRQILIGNRELMLAHGIQPPSHDYEKKYIQSGKRLVYLASEGTLVAMFIINYRSDLHRSQVLRRMERNGIGLIVRTRDPNITPRFLAECFGLYEQEITVLPEHLGKIYTDLVSAEPERADAMIATKGRAFAMIRLLTGCIRQRSNITAAVALQAAAVGLGFALVAFLSLYSGLQQLSLTALSVYELFWAVAVLLVPRIRRP